MSSAFQIPNAQVLTYSPHINPHTPMPTHIFVVEDHPLMREMLSEFLPADAPDLKVCGTAATGEEALGCFEDAEADLMLIDVALPGGMSGIDLVGELRARRPGLPCLMYSGHGEVAYVERALAAGAQGYLLKGDPYELEGAIRQVLDGATFVSEQVANTFRGSKMEDRG